MIVNAKGKSEKGIGQPAIGQQKDVKNVQNYNESAFRQPEIVAALEISASMVSRDGEKQFP